ncbi:hypothetical protein PHMEG_00027817 [Phytophthora megakarya]|uniref:Uncharacterized protein n=1 Tax=Phytophthora megakarya TaxID=4795 RepID=A0A225V6C1_9STRA|nr:hypothetical protein PHMEG_00027817 [Phytophthora megakarya]
MAGASIRQWVLRIFGDCLKKHNDEVNVDFVNDVGKENTTIVALTPAPLIDILPVHLQPCAPANSLDPVLWTETNRLVNAAAAWQIRGVMPVDVATMSYFTLVMTTTPELAWRFTAAPILMVLRADNKTLCELPLELLSADSFAKLTLFERRAIHNVLGTRPNGWNDVQLVLYAARERELIAAANEEFSDVWHSGRHIYDSFYMVTLPFTYSRYAREPVWF